ncbi:LysR family transcriptional regulator [Neomegalonema perideroedes]|uniref:LysR family transcriptional regulator n=1 Tax=Neomegalonema perideroedes TaxID=217219 RepID=UPI0003705500|nr:LysR family transcriptional regulator [Neomegalonema perideroedes]
MDNWGQPKRPLEGVGVDVDTRQLRVLLAILERRSVTAAAAALGQSQPAVSQTLRRMREATGDPLLVRSGSKLVPTERAQAMMEPLRRALADLEEAIRPSQVFDPASQDHEFRIASADCMGAFFAPRLISSIRSASPRSRIMLRAVVSGFDYVAALEKGEIDAVIANWPSPPGNLRMTRLMSDGMVCLFGPAHPLSGKNRISMSDYMRLGHVAPSPLSATAPGPIDGRLAELGLTRDIRVMAPEFNLIPYVLLNTDLVFTSSRGFARHYQGILPIRALPAPEEFGVMRFYLLWHERMQHSAAHRWLRERVVEVAHRVAAEIAADSGAAA